MNQERFRFFASAHLESDLLIGVSHDHFREEMIAISNKELIRLRTLLQDFTEKYPIFGTSLEPIQFSEVSNEISPGQVAPENFPSRQELPEEIASMMDCGISSGTGPMSAVAGLFAEHVGKTLIKGFGLKEVVVENGGDLFMLVESDIVSVIHAGFSPLSDKMAFIIPPGTWGVCTSSGIIGHSFSRGKADAVTIIAKSIPLADAWATSFANQVITTEDIEPVLEKIPHFPEILGCAIIVGERIGIRGEIEVKLLS